MNKRGYTLLELCVVVFILGLCATFALRRESVIDYAFYQFMDDYYKIQSEAFITRSPKSLKMQDIALSFNEKGNVNKGQTIQFLKNRVIVHIANGSLRYE